MQKVKLNINNKQPSNNFEKELIEQARQSMEEKKNIKTSSTGVKGGKTGLLVLIAIVLAASTGTAAFMIAKKQNRQPYRKFIPESTVISIALAPKNLASAIKASASLIFPQTIAELKSETAILGVDAEKILSGIKQEIILASIKLSEDRLDTVIIAQFPENFEKQELENKIRQNFNVSYQTYRGKKIVSVEPLELSKRNKAFSYAIIENVLLASQNIDALKISIGAGK